MSAASTTPSAVSLAPVHQASAGLWKLAWRRLKRDKVGMVSLAVVLFFILMMIGSFTRLIAKNWSKEVGVSYANPLFMHGAENLEAVKKSTDPSAKKIPTADLSDIDPLAPRYKEWEERTAKIKITETPRAESLPLGGDKWGRDVLQNVVQFIKAEVILSFLGLGVPVDSVSWGTMLAEAQAELVIGKWWQLAAAGISMAILVTAFSMLTDSLRDALDPKIK